MGIDRRAAGARARRAAASQRGLITRAQARECGLTDRQIQGLFERGEWSRVFQGVYVVSATEPAWKQLTLGACLSRAGVAASHQTGATLWELDGAEQAPTTVHVTALQGTRPTHPCVVVHRTSRPFVVHRAQGVPVTTIERTLLDIAVSSSDRAVELAVEDALRRRLTTIARLTETLDRDGGRGRPGSKQIRGILEVRGTAPPTESILEVDVYRTLRRAGLRGLVRQHPFRRSDGSCGRIDLALPDNKIAVEVDGYRWHSGREAWRRDLQRRNDLVALGWTVLHATKEDAAEGCRVLIQTIRSLMASDNFAAK